jgi:hypothetical protein
MMRNKKPSREAGTAFPVRLQGRLALDLLGLFCRREGIGNVTEG